MKGLWVGILHLDLNKFQHVLSSLVTERDHSNKPVAIGLGGVVGLKTIPKTLTAGWPVPDRFGPSLNGDLIWISMDIEYRPANMENLSSIFPWYISVEIFPRINTVLLQDGETVHNAFFDRSYKEG